MKNILCTLFLLGVVTPTLLAQGDNNIIGLYVEVVDDNGNAPPDYEMWLSSINTQTGDINQISNQGFGNTTSNFTSTVDPINNIFYYTNGNNIIAINEQNGDFISSTSMQLQDYYYFQQFVFNEVDLEIYGLERTSLNGGEVFLSKIDPATGVVTRLSDNSISDSICNFDMALDPINEIYYFTNCSDLISVDINSGSVINSVPISIPNADYFSHFKFNISDGMIYGISRTPNPPEVFLAKLNPQTGVVTNVSQQSIASSVSIAEYALDPLNEIFYIKAQSELRGISMQTGNIVSSPQIGLNNGHSFNLIYFRNSKIQLNTQDFSTVDVDLFPVPAKNQIQISTSHSFDTFEIYDMTGKLITKDDFSPLINIEYLNQGIYFLKLSNQATVVKQKFIVE
jgi:hypothetical protein